MIKITRQSNGEQAPSSLFSIFFLFSVCVVVDFFLLLLLIITPSRCYSISLKCRQLTNQLLRAELITALLLLHIHELFGEGF